MLTGSPLNSPPNVPQQQPGPAPVATAGRPLRGELPSKKPTAAWASLFQGHPIGRFASGGSRETRQAGRSDGPSAWAHPPGETPTQAEKQGSDLGRIPTGGFGRAGCHRPIRGVAQSRRALGSYPRGRWSEATRRNQIAGQTHDHHAPLHGLCPAPRLFPTSKTEPIRC